MALNVKKVSQLNEVSYSTVDGSALFYIATNTGDKSYNIQLSNLFLATNNLSTFKFANDTLTVSNGALNTYGTFNLTGTLGVSGSSTLSTLNTGNTSITGTLGVSGNSTLSTLNTGNTSITGTLGVSGNVTGNSIIKSGGTSSQFLKADGSVDSNSYITSTYLDVARHDVTTQRAINTTYTNTSGKKMSVLIGISFGELTGGGVYGNLILGGISFLVGGNWDSTDSEIGGYMSTVLSFDVLPGETYRLAFSCTINKWIETY